MSLYDEQELMLLAISCHIREEERQEMSTICNNAMTFYHSLEENSNIRPHVTCKDIKILSQVIDTT